METNATNATPATKIARGTKQNVNVVILDITRNANMTNKAGEKALYYILHIKPTVQNPKGIITIPEGKMTNWASSHGFDDIDMFLDMLIGGRYQNELQFVYEGDSYLDGSNGAYKKDHFANVPKSEKIVLNEAEVVLLKEERRKAYIANKYASKKETKKAVAVPQLVLTADDVTGDEIPA